MESYPILSYFIFLFNSCEFPDQLFANEIILSLMFCKFGILLKHHLFAIQQPTYNKCFWGRIFQLSICWFGHFILFYLTKMLEIYQITRGSSVASPLHVIPQHFDRIWIWALAVHSKMFIVFFWKTFLCWLGFVIWAIIVICFGCYITLKVETICHNWYWVFLYYKNQNF